MHPSDSDGCTFFQVVPGTDQSIAALLKQMLKLVSVIEATDISSIPFVQRELMMVKVLADMQGRSSVLQVAGIFRAKVSPPSQRARGRAFLLRSSSNTWTPRPLFERT